MRSEGGGAPAAPLPGRPLLPPSHTQPRLGPPSSPPAELGLGFPLPAPPPQQTQVPPRSEAAGAPNLLSTSSERGGRGPPALQGLREGVLPHSSALAQRAAGGDLPPFSAPYPEDSRNFLLFTNWECPGGVLLPSPLSG